MAKKKARIVAIVILASAFSGIFLLADLALKLALSRQVIESKKKVASLDLLISKPEGVIADLRGGSIGRLIQEGSLTNKVRTEGRHHDNENDYLQLSKGDKSLIVIGDSWGDGVRRENQSSHVMSKLVGDRFGSIRFISTGSWSPLLMTLAVRNRLSKYYKNGVDYAVVMIDQTDIGDDYCRYRPYVYRSRDGRLLGVDFSKSEFGGSNRWERHLALGDHRSGILLAIARVIHSINARILPDHRLLEYCHYEDLVAWQRGVQMDSTGASAMDHQHYFLKTLQDLVNEIKAYNQATRILITTHDWAQHSLPAAHKSKFKKNISELALLVARKNKNVQTLHVATADYGRDASKVYGYPGDLFSHPNEYKTLSKLIASKLSQMVGDR